MSVSQVNLNTSPSTVGFSALIIFGLISVLYMILAFYKITDTSFDQRGWTAECSIAMTAWVFAYVTATRLYFKTVYLYTTVFISCLLLFHYGLIFQHAVGTIKGNIWPESLLPWVSKAAWATALACGSLGLGIAFASLFAKQKFVASEFAAFRYKKLKDFAYKYYVGLFIASAVLIVLAIILSGNIFSFSRFELFFGDHPGLRFVGVFTMVFPSAISLFILAPRSKFGRKKALIVAAFCFVLLLLTGYRSIALFPLFVAVVTWTKLGNKIPAFIAVSLILLTLLSISVIGFLRHQGSYESFDAKTLAASLEKADIEQSLSSMGRSVGVLAHTMRIIPEQDDYRLGRTYWLYLSKSIPNIGSVTDESDSRAALYKRISANRNALRDLIPSDWATYWILPTQFKTGGGVGFTAVGEPYMNFGLPGIVIYFFLLGMFLFNFDRKDIRYNPKWFVFASCFYWYLVVTVRNDFGNFVKPAAFLLLIMLAWSIASRFIPMKTR
ncbi:MAG: hypothetical protein ACI9CO_000596 [Candidatus Azotimanducaceae bacterium]|jgi:hypothetical protein